MPHLINPHQEPFGGWKYLQAETLAAFTSDNLDSLVEKVRLHRAYKGLKPDDAEGVRRDVEAQLCLGLDTRYCAGDAGEKWSPLSIFFNLSVDQILDFTKAMFAWLKAGGEFADKKVAVERAAICRACPLNHRAHACACGPLYAMVDSLVPGERREPGLHVCHVCGCSLTLKVVMPQGVIHAQNANSPKSYPAFCWIPRE